MNKLKMARILLVIFILLAVASCIPSFFNKENYNFTKVDLTKDENKIALVNDFDYNFGAHSANFTFTLYNLTETRIENVVVNFKIVDRFGNINVISNPFPYTLSSRKEFRNSVWGSCDGYDYSSIIMTIKIGDGEEFEVKHIETLIQPVKQFEGFSGFSPLLFLFFLILSIIMFVKLKKMPRKSTELEYLKTFETLDEKQNSKDNKAQINTIECEYCGQLVNIEYRKCECCGATIRKKKTK